MNSTIFLSRQIDFICVKYEDLVIKLLRMIERSRPTLGPSAEVLKPEVCVCPPTVPGSAACWP